MKIINVQNQSKEWLEWRRSGIGSSDIAAIMGKCPFKTKGDILKDKLGLSENKPNAAMKRGTELEDVARKMFEEKFGRKYPPIMVQDNDCEYFIASVDGWDKWANAIEIKVPGRRTCDLAACGVIPENYKLQMQWILMIMQQNYIYYVVYDVDNEELYIVKYDQDEDLQKQMVEAAHAFWGEVIAARENPPESDQKYAPQINKEIEKAFEIKAQIKKLEKEYEEIIAELHKEHGETHTLIADYFILQRTERESFDYRQAAIDAFAPLHKYSKPKTVSWTIKKQKSADYRISIGCIK